MKTAARPCVIVDGTGHKRAACDVGPPGPDRGRTAATAPYATAAKSWPLNTGTPFAAGCSAPALQLGEVFTEQQVQTAYGVGTLRARASGTPVITILDLGGGWLPSDLKLAGQCFGYSPPRVDQVQGDGVATTIQNADPETSLDLETAAAVAPKAQFRLVQSTPAGGGILDGFSRALGDPDGLPDVISLPYGGCAIEENTATPAFASPSARETAASPRRCGTTRHTARVTPAAEL